MTYVAQLALTARCPARNSRTAADGARQFATMFTPSHVLSPHYARPTSPTTGTSPSGSDYVIFAAFICKVVRNYIVCKAV
ncbi:hypothetical protein ACLK2I_09115 [Escherichia coli]